MIALLTTVWFLAQAHGAAIFPPVSYLEQSLGLSTNRPLPKGVIYNNRAFFAYYVRGKAMGNGEYMAILKLRAQ